VRDQIAIAQLARLSSACLTLSALIEDEAFQLDCLAQGIAGMLQPGQIDRQEGRGVVDDPPDLRPIGVIGPGQATARSVSERSS